MVSPKNCCLSTLAPMTSLGLDARTMVNRACCTMKGSPIRHSFHLMYLKYMLSPCLITTELYIFPCSVYYQTTSNQSPRESAYPLK